MCTLISHLHFINNPIHTLFCGLQWDWPAFVYISNTNCSASSSNFTQPPGDSTHGESSRVKQKVNEKYLANYERNNKPVDFAILKFETFHVLK